ncbi:TonB-dependent receptor [candidate division KSB1 bacterium]|nr:TonB-dependent receptor [candidate division KSB1 bacterium]
MLHKILTLFLVLSIVIFCVPKVFAASSGTIVGVIKDEVTGDPLPGANVFIEGTAIGSASDLKGHYQISRVPPGSFTLKVTYIGYRDKRVPFKITLGETKTIDVELIFDVVEGETVTITAQAEGQVAAINQQLRSNTIKNIVSAERIMELPDANAAESVGRLPGISILRSGGEANRIVIRGLSPTYNTVTIGGEKIPATDLDDRSVDMNMISPEILAGIEVTKSLTPDQDADAIGGTVNFKLADAPSGFRYNFRFQEGYNAQRDETGQYKGSITLSNRFWSEKLGVMVTGNRERAQRGSDQFGASYIIGRDKREGEQFAPLTTQSVNLEYIDELRERTSFSVLFDYHLPNGKLMFSNFLSRLDRNEQIYSNSFGDDMNSFTPAYRNRVRQIDVISNSLAGEHTFSTFKFDWRLARTSSLTRHPYDNTYTFREEGAFDRSELPQYFTPDEFIGAAKRNINNTTLFSGALHNEKSFECNNTIQMNLEIPYILTNKIVGHIKMGGKYRDKSKERDRSYMAMHSWSMPGDETILEHYHTKYGTPGFEYKWHETGLPSILNYYNPNFDAGNFLNGEYDLTAIPDVDELDYLYKNYGEDSMYVRSSLADMDDYEVMEKVASGYIMSEINLGRFIMFMPGVRYEHTEAEMTGRKGVIPWEFQEINVMEPMISDTMATNKYGRWFPMYHFRVRPTNWFDVRLAYTKTLSRPRLDWMLPKKSVHSQKNTVDFGRPDLKPQISTNYDIYLSFYSNKVGLLTWGGFYKEIDDLIFRRTGHYILDPEVEGFSPELKGFIVNRAENNPNLTKVKGWEVEWQTNFHWLPKPLDGFVLNVNYTHLWSETQFPRSFVEKVRIPKPPFVTTTVIDTFRVGSMPNQADDIANISIGYDKGPFSARYSLLYQGRTLRSPGESPELDGFTADLLRMDLSVKYKLTNQIGLFLNCNNITNEPDEAFQMATAFPERYPTSREFYSWTLDFGIGYKF